VVRAGNTAGFCAQPEKALSLGPPRDSVREQGDNLVKLASLVLVLSASLLVSDMASAQDTASPVYASPAPQPVYAAPPARAEGAPGTIKDRSVHDRPISLSAQGYIPWIYGIGIGVRLGVEIPVAKDGFIPSINDSVSVEPNFYFAYSNYYGWSDSNLVQFTPAASGLWNFHLKPALTVYGMVTLGVTIRHWTGAWRGTDANDGVFFGELAGGVKWKFADRIALRAELGWYGPRCGVSFDL
jgi:hypothetical protein